MMQRQSVIVCSASLVVLLFGVALATAADEASRAEALRRMSRGAAAVEVADNEEGFLRAAEEFRQAIAADPDLAAAYYNLGIVLDQAGQYDEAMDSLQQYLEKAPNAVDTHAVQQLIYKIEFRQEDAARQAQEAQEQQWAAEAAEQAKMDISGVWIEEDENPMSTYSTRYHITTAWDGSYDVQKRGAYQEVGYSDSYRLTVDDYSISGTVTFDWTNAFSNGDVWTRDVRGTLASDSDTMWLQFSAVGPNGAVGDVADGFREYDDDRVLLRYE